MHPAAAVDRNAAEIETSAVNPGDIQRLGPDLLRAAYIAHLDVAARRARGDRLKVAQGLQKSVCP